MIKKKNVKTNVYKTALIKSWNELSATEKNQLNEQLSSINYLIVSQQKKLLKLNKTEEKKKKEKGEAEKGEFDTFSNYAYAGNKKDLKAGKNLIKQGQLGCIILSGGQGTRLNSNGPKGMFPISVIKNKSLFQIYAEKVLAAGKQVNRKLLLAIMTSPQNDAIIRNYFTENNYFGLDAGQVFFFIQGQLPLLDDEGNLILESRNHIALGPNGNGYCFHEFVKQGIWKKWEERGVRYVNVIPVDNPLADPFDAELLGYHVRCNFEVTSKSVQKDDPEEKVGVFVIRDMFTKVVEYSELSEKEKFAKKRDGVLRHSCASVNMFCFSMNFIKRISYVKKMPLHMAWKANAWKFEAFLFDVLDYTRDVGALIYPRETCFAPLKNMEGRDSPETVRAALQNLDRKVIEKITGKPAPEGPMELSMDFYYPTEELEKRWKGKIVISGYIEGN